MVKLLFQMDMKDTEVYHCENLYAEIADTLYDLLDEEITWSVFPVKVFNKVFDQPRESSYVSAGETYDYSGFIRKPTPWSPILEALRDRLTEIARILDPDHPEFNAVLCNRYTSGDSYIGEHSDDEKDLCPNSYIFSLTFGAVRDFVFRNKKTGEKIVVPLKSGSLIVMGKNCQKLWKHGVPKRKKVKTPRINLTFRCMRNVK